jgi:uncharacterized protein
MLVTIGRDTPLIGCIAFGIIDRGTTLLQIRPTSVCNLNCTFCSVDGGPESKWHNNFFTVELDYLVEETEKVIAFKGCDIEINIDSVGEPFCYPHLEELVKRFRNNQRVKKISIQTNGMFSKSLDVDVVNLSIHAMDPALANRLANASCYDIEKVKSFLQTYLDKKIDVRLCPVWIPGINDEEVPKIIQFAKEKGCSLGIQKYETYKYSRKMKAKPLNWYKFYRQIELWEKEFDIQLKLKAKEFEIAKAPRIPEVFKKGEKVKVEIKQPGWFKDQMIGVAKDRCVSIINCDKKIGDLVNVKILETKNNLYIAE